MFIEDRLGPRERRCQPRTGINSTLKGSKSGTTTSLAPPSPPRFSGPTGRLSGLVTVFLLWLAFLLLSGSLSYLWLSGDPSWASGFPLSSSSVLFFFGCWLSGNSATLLSRLWFYLGSWYTWLSTSGRL
ncbi:hypothetical protein NLI96_g5763 [Meripilus lineatus]|uniref:Uncharacterized protein n=1 Tax=Meripilus lineatus TaxID=2056292 RepID=A0AAD5V4J5_9APHY|nr:hypothetical protein NLI96_g5763 [Physisporinus lineatus]